jgi:hypothetical protein
MLFSELFENSSAYSTVTNPATGQLYTKAELRAKYARPVEMPSDDPAVAPELDKPTSAVAPPPPKPGTRIQTSAGPVDKGIDGRWRTIDNEIIVNLQDIRELERRARKQIRLAAQNKQMSPASGIKESP